MLIDLTSRLRHTADDVAAVVLVPVSHVQQQVGAVRVGSVSGLGANHRLIFHLLIDFIEMQLSYTIDNTGSSQRSDAAIPVYRLCKQVCYTKCSCQGFEPVLVKTTPGRKQLTAANKPSHIVPLCTLTPELPYFLYPDWPSSQGEGDLKSLPLWRRCPTERPQTDKVTPLGFLFCSGGDAENILREVIVWQRGGWQFGPDEYTDAGGVGIQVGLWLRPVSGGYWVWLKVGMYVTE